MQDNPNFSRTTLVFVGLALAVLVIVLWVAFDLPIGGIIEEWVWVYNYSINNLHPFSNESQHWLRPLNPLNMWLPIMATQGSFLGLNIAYILLFWGKGLVTYLILRQLRFPVAFALLVSALFVVYPADTGLITMRALPGHTGLLTFLLALYSLLRWRASGGVVYPALMVVMLLLTYFNYEATLPLALLAPALVLLINPRRDRQLWTMLGIWYAIVLILGIRVVIGVTADSSYQNEIVSRIPMSQLITEAPIYLFGAYQRSLYIGWGEALQQVLSAPPFYLGLGVIAALVVSATVWGLWQPVFRPQRRVWLGLVAAGLVIIGAGFALFLLSVLRSHTVRTYYVSSLGGALLVGTLIWAISWLLQRYQRVVFSLLSALVLFVAVVWALKQQEFYADRSARQQAFTASVVEQVPGLTDETELMLILDTTGRLISEEYFYSERYLGLPFWGTYGFLYYYEPFFTEMDVRICADTRPIDDNRCEFEAQQLTMHISDEMMVGDEVYTYDSVVVLKYNIDGTIELLDEVPPWYTDGVTIEGYQPERLICTGCPPQPFYEKVILAPPIETAVIPVEEARIEFTNDFNGYGWGVERTSTTQAGEVITYQFMVNESATLEIPLVPQSYHLLMRVANNMTAELRGSLAISINGQPLPLTTLPQGQIEAQIPQSAITEPVSILLFQVDPRFLTLAQEGTNAVGIGFDWLEITPRSVEAMLQTNVLYVEFENDFTGSGWGVVRNAEAEGTSFTYRFMTEAQASIDAPLLPQEYRLRMRISNNMTNDLRQSLQVRFNDQPLTLTSLSGGVVEATIPASAFVETGNMLIFEVDPQALADAQIPGRAPVGIGFDWVEITSAAAASP